MTYRIGIDIGGTFTDFAIIDDEKGRIVIHKQLTTPHDPSECVLDGIEKLLSRLSIGIHEVTAIVHGTTLVTNAVIERKGAKTGMLVTRGFRDVLDMGLERRYDLYDLRIHFASPMVDRQCRREIDERVCFDGAVSRELDTNQILESTHDLIENEGISALAICFLHSYARQDHEREAAEAVKKSFPDLYVSSSADVLPFQREFARWTTTVINAYTQPMTDRYLSRIEDSLKRLGFDGLFLIMTSNGGTVTAALARRYPVRLIESGPAAGALMSSFIGNRIGCPDLLSFDMGGTTAKGALVRDGKPLKKFELEVAREHGYRTGSGHSLQIPVIDMIEIGAGGGSIASVDTVGMLTVGPHSAGANPGPVSYGLGGKEPTVTDTNVVLGYLDPDFFLGGKMTLDRRAAEEAISSKIAQPLRLESARAAWGIHEVASEDVARAFRIHAAELGFDYRTCSMIAFGGSGPVHAVRIARKLQVPRVIFPAGAGVVSAIGLLVSPLSFETMRSLRVPVDGLSANEFSENFAEAERQAVGFLADAGVAAFDVKIARRLDMRYVGQGYEIEISVPSELDDPTAVEHLPQLFAEAYQAIFVRTLLESPIEIVNWKIEASGPVPRFAADYSMVTETNGVAPLKRYRDVYFPETKGYISCPVYDRYALLPDTEIVGPALIEENESTCAIGIGDVVRIDDRQNLVVQITQR